MRLFYTTAECPFTDTEIEEALHETGDKIISKGSLEIPLIGNDETSPLRFDDYGAYIADSMVDFLERLPGTVTLGDILIVDKPLIITTDTKFTTQPGKIDDFYTRGASVPFLVAILSIVDLTHEQALKVFRHEMGHFYGLPHCEDTMNCLMTSFDYNDMTILDNSSMELCSVCINKLKALEV